MTTTEIANRLALKELVDTFSNLADIKDVSAQMDLFKEDAKVISINGDQEFVLEGKEAISKAFSDYLALFHTVYHLNGQQTLTFQDEHHAKGISYCQVVLITNQDGKEVTSTSGVRYQDSYEKVEGKWLIAHRKSHFMWTKAERTDLS